MIGLVTKSTGSWYSVKFEDKEYNCRIRGKLRLKGLRTTNPITVGDLVSFELEDQQSDQGVITAIEPRHNYIIRRSTNLSKQAHIIAANVDNVFLVVTLDFPPTPNEFIDRFLVSCELFKVSATIILNKMDLFEAEDFREVIDDFKEIYNGAGYEVIECSTISKIGIKQIKERMENKISLFSGNSGVGKSSIIREITENSEIKVGDVSDAHHKGRHTTTFSEMFELSNNTYLIDTPGIKGFGLIDVKKEEIARYFPDLFKHSKDCRFYNCTHTHEPHCAVKESVESGELSVERYSSYLKMLEEHDNDKYRGAL